MEKIEITTSGAPAIVTAVARLIDEPARARRLADALAETIDPAGTAVSVFESGAATWTVEIHFQHMPDEAALRQLVWEIAGADAARALMLQSVAQKDWVAASLADLKPVSAGRFVVHGAHDRTCVPLHRIGIEIEAALAFGTGHHGTTRGCLMALDHLLKERRPRRVLDIGTGTGVLAIATAKAARCPVLASDIDKRALYVARDNAQRNHVAMLIEFVHGRGLAAQRLRERAPFDLIFANILLEPLKLMAAAMAHVTAAGACLILSGLLPSQVAAALSAYRPQGFRLKRSITLEGWTTLVLRHD